MKANFTIYFKNDKAYIRDNINDSIIRHFKFSVLNSVASSLPGVAGRNIDIVFDESMEIYSRLNILSKLEDVGCNVDVLNKHMCIIKTYLNHLWELDNKEICDIDDERMILFIDLLDKDICISFIKVRNLISRLDIDIITQNKGTIIIDKKGIDKYLKESETSDFYADAKQYVNLEIRDFVEECYVRDIHMLKDTTNISTIVLLGDLANHGFVKEYFNNEFRIADENTVMIVDEKDMVFEGVKLSSGIDNRTIKMPFIKDDIRYLSRCVSFFQVPFNEALEDNRIILNKSNMIPAKSMIKTMVSSNMGTSVIYRLGITDEDTNNQKGIDIEMDFPFIYAGDLVELYVEVKKDTELTLEYEIKHIKSNYSVKDNVIII